MKRACTLTTIIAAIGTASCASSHRTADNPSSSIEPYRSSMSEDFFAPLSIREASQVVTMPRAVPRYQPAGFAGSTSPGFISLGAGDALGIRVRLADSVIARAPMTWDLTEVPTD